MKNLVDTMNLLVKHIINIDSKAVHLDNAETVTGDKAFTGGVTVGGYEPECVVAKGDKGIRYASGLQICWGGATVTNYLYTSASNASRNVPVTFGWPFANTAYEMSLSGYTGARDLIYTISDKTVNGFTIGVRNSYNSSGDWMCYVGFVAIGWWK